MRVAEKIGQIVMGADDLKVRTDTNWMENNKKSEKLNTSNHDFGGYDFFTPWEIQKYIDSASAV